MCHGRLVVGSAPSLRGSDNGVIIREFEVGARYCVHPGVAATSGKPVLHTHIVDQACGVDVVVCLAAYCEP